ncbi:MAG: hypothetical protein ABF837_05085 [Zymomonas mobilis]
MVQHFAPLNLASRHAGERRTRGQREERKGRLTPPPSLPRARPVGGLPLPHAPGPVPCPASRAQDAAPPPATNPNPRTGPAPDRLQGRRLPPEAEVPPPAFASGAVYCPNRACRARPGWALLAVSHCLWPTGKRSHVHTGEIGKRTNRTCERRYAEPRRLPGIGEQVDAVPAIERNGKAAPFQDTMHLVEGRPKPARIVIVADFPPVPALIVHQIRRVCQDEIHRITGHRPHKLHAVAIKDRVAEIGRRVGVAGHGLCPLFREEQPPLFLCLAASSGVATARATDGEGYHPVCTERSAGRSGTPHRAASARWREPLPARGRSH